MALITTELLLTTTAELQEQLGANGYFNVELITPDLLNAQRRDLQPLLGKEQLEDLIEKYYASLPPPTEEDPEAVELDDDHKHLLHLCHKILVNLAASRYTALGSIDFSAAGLRIAEDQSYKTAKQWQVDDLREYFATNAYGAMDELLEYLELNAETFTIWAADTEAYTINKKFIVPSASTFQDYADISTSRRTFLAMYPHMRATEAFVIETAIGKPLYDRIKAEILAATITEEIEDILPWLQGATTQYTVARAAIRGAIEIRHNGIYLNSYTSGADRNNRARTTADPLALQRLEYSSSSEGQQWLQKVVDHLNSTATAELYPEWFNGTLYTAPEEETTDTPTATTNSYNTDNNAKTFML